MKLSLKKAALIFDKKRLNLVISIFRRKGLSAEKRVLCLVATLQAISGWRHLSGIMESSLEKPEDIGPLYEILLQGYLFCGYPRAIESFFCLDEVMRRKGLLLPANLPISRIEAEISLKRGIKLAGQINRDKFPKIYDKISALSPDLGYLMIAEGYGNILCRDGVDIKTRELAVVSSLSASGAVRQLNSHIRGALNVGCAKRQIMEAILTGLPLLGSARVMKSLAVWSEITGEPISQYDFMQARGQ